MALLWEASKNGEIAQVNQLVEEDGVSVDEGGGTDNNIKSPICFAALGGHLDVVRYLKEKGAQLGRGVWSNDTPLCCASRNGHLEIVKYLLETNNVWVEEEGEDKDGNKKSPLCWAALNGHFEIVKYLVLQGKSRIKGDGDYLSETPLSCASKGGKLEIVKFLLINGAEVNQKEWSNELGYMTPLCWAAAGGHLDIVRFLVGRGAEFVGQGLFYSYSPLCCASREGCIDVVKFFAELEVDINEEGGIDGHVPVRKSPVCWAASGNYHEVVRYLDWKGARLTKREGKGFYDDTPLCCASRKGHCEVVEYLTTPRVPVNEEGSLTHGKQYKRRTPLSWAITAGCLEAVKILIRNGATVNPNILPNTDGQVEANERQKVDGKGDFENLSPLSMAAVKGNIEIIEYLLEQGAYKDDKSGQKHATALWYAALHGQKESVRVLLQRNVLIDAQSNADGSSPLIAAVAGNKEQSDEDRLQVVRLLLNYNATIDAKDKLKDEFNKTALMHAVSAYPPRTADLVQMLLVNGASINDTNARGRTALHLAHMLSSGTDDSMGIDFALDEGSRARYGQFIDLLRQHGADETIRDGCNKIPSDYANNN